MIVLASILGRSPLHPEAEFSHTCHVSVHRGQARFTNLAQLPAVVIPFRQVILGTTFASFDCLAFGIHESMLYVLAEIHWDSGWQKYYTISIILTNITNYE